MDKTICELFAGVGGFRLGFDKIDKGWKTVWFSQWEPGAKTQWAHQCYIEHFGDSKDLNGEYHTCEDIAEVDKNTIPNHNLLVGGFPCQDYSVANTLSLSKGIEGKKGVLWWEINKVLIAKQPSFCLFENVDRLLKSPAKQRGRDFAVILACLDSLGYVAEWRIVNAAEYGAAQRRRRTFIFAYKNNTKHYELTKDIKNNGLMAKSFPAKYENEKQISIDTSNIVEISNNFKYDFQNAGYINNGIITTYKAIPIVEKPILLKDIIIPCEEEKYYENVESRYDRWIYLKGGKKVERTTKEGYKYTFSEGPVAFPDAWDKPARTMLTSEGTLNRSTHVIADSSTGRLRTLHPIEAERIQGFDDNWTKCMPERMRFFCMGNALVVPMISRMAIHINDIFDLEI